MTFAPGTLLFLGGLCAGAGINMLTSAATDPQLASAQLIVDSALWVVAAVLLTATANARGTAEAAAALATGPTWTAEEIAEKRADVLREHRPRIVLLQAGTAVMVVLAVVLVPNLVFRPPVAPSSTPSVPSPSLDKSKWRSVSPDRGK